MASSGFRVDQIDHVEVFVPDHSAAAHWYEQTLGLQVLRQHQDWAGPGLMVSSDGGSTMLALFEGEPRGTRPTAGHHRVAFRVRGDGFLLFLEHIRDFPVFSEAGDEVRELARGRPWQGLLCLFLRSLREPVRGDHL